MAKDILYSHAILAPLVDIIAQHLNTIKSWCDANHIDGQYQRVNIKVLQIKEVQ